MPRPPKAIPQRVVPPDTVARMLVAAALLLGYAAFLCSNAVLSAGGSESSGYLNAAKLLALGKLTDAVEPLAHFNLSQDFVNVFLPLRFSPGAEPGTMAPSSPLGLPLHMAAAGLAGGWSHAPFWVSPLAAALCLLLVYGIGRELEMSRPFAAAAAACLGVFPSFFWFALQPMSDVPSTAWGLAAVLAALRARRHAGAAWFCGAAFGMAILVRPTNILLAVPLLLALPPERGVFLRVALGGLPFAGFLLAANQIASGNPFAIGYGNLSSAFSFVFFPARILHYLYWLGALGSPLLLLGWPAVAWARSLSARDRALLLAWPAVFLLFFCFYENYEAWWYTRFLLPGLPAMILSLFIVVERGIFVAGFGRAAAAWRDVRPFLAAAVTVIVLAAGVYWISRFGLLNTKAAEQIYPDAARWAAAAVPRNSVIAAMQMTGAMKYYTNATFARLDGIDPALLPALRTQVRAAGYHWYALLAPGEREMLQTSLPGSWKEIGRLRDHTLLRLDKAP